MVILILGWWSNLEKLNFELQVARMTGEQKDQVRQNNIKFTVYL